MPDLSQIFTQIQDPSKIPGYAIPELRQYGFDGPLVGNNDQQGNPNGTYKLDSENAQDLHAPSLGAAIQQYNIQKQAQQQALQQILSRQEL